MRNFGDSDGANNKSWQTIFESDIFTYVENEASFIVTEIPKETYVNERRQIKTRAQGPVEVYPWVQSST